MKLRSFYLDSINHTAFIFPTPMERVYLTIADGYIHRFVVSFSQDDSVSFISDREKERHSTVSSQFSLRNTEGGIRAGLPVPVWKPLPLRVIRELPDESVNV